MPEPLTMETFAAEQRPATTHRPIYNLRWVARGIPEIREGQRLDFGFDVYKVVRVRPNGRVVLQVVK